jgi:3-hydroxybutyryl-CoA dehydratase
MKGPIAHGMLIGSLFSEVFANELSGPGTIYVSQSLSFVAPVIIGTQAEVVVTVQSHIGRKINVRTKVLCDGEICVDGEAELLMPKLQPSVNVT